MISFKPFSLFISPTGHPSEAHFPASRITCSQANLQIDITTDKKIEKIDIPGLKTKPFLISPSFNAQFYDLVFTHLLLLISSLRFSISSKNGIKYDPIRKNMVSTQLFLAKEGIYFS